MRSHVHIRDRAALSDAAALIEAFGEHASREAAARADRSRMLGNVLHFCHWRQIQRTIAMLNDADPRGAVH